MSIWNNVFASAYLYYARFKNETPRVSAICIVWVCQMASGFLLVAIIGRLLSANLLKPIFPNKFYAVPLMLVWLLMLFRIYNNDRVESILTAFKQLNSQQKKIWSVVAISAFVLPIILFFLVLIVWK
jgi:hypothetical protein